MLSWNPHTQSFYQTVGSPEVDTGVVGYISFRRTYERKGVKIGCCGYDQFAMLLICPQDWIEVVCTVGL
jgi:hypothetical protein